MKILVFGAREFFHAGVILRVLSKLPKDTILVNGGARGADIIADRIGRELGFTVRSYPIPSEEWTQYGFAAGPLRNKRMLQSEHPDSDGVRIDKAYGFSTGHKNKGTRDMASKLWEAKIRFEILSPL